DQREHPEPINVNLRMLRFAIQNITGRNYPLAQNHTVEVHTVEQTAASTLGIDRDRITLTQRFTEGDFYSSAAVAVRITGCDSRARYLDESTVQLSAAPARGKVMILISSAASLDAKTDTAAAALAQLDGADSFEQLATQTQSWWHEFWARSYVSMHSPDGQ